ncbi:MULTISPECIES: TolC family protein [Bizionia]|uniref:TolC family protein n=1 Tax=Bizionia algoritergicola TaxID=291187 RepID=A0A5D0R140_9FLAO|nr:MULTISPECIES: TolC family protein [Bizionia]OBX22493.1 transporter [Bizionia sp. APA-3]TYB74606.1 TolC family protein [Bizionia algoritergicola]
MIRIFIIIIIYLTTAILNTISAQNTLIFKTIEETIDYAIENNNDLESVQINQEIIQAQIAEVKGRALPQINGNAGFTDNFSLQEQQLPGEIFGGEPGSTIGVAFGNRYQYSAGLNVQQELLNFQLFNSVRSASALAELRNLETLLTTQDLIVNVIQTYIQIQVFEKQLELLQQNYDRTDNLIKLSDSRFQEGIIKKLDLNQLLVNRSNLKTQVEDAEYGKNQQIRLFKVLLNVPINIEIVLLEKIEDRNPYPLGIEFLLESNLEYQQLDKSVELSIIDQKLIKSEFLPTLSANFGYNYLGQANEFANFDSNIYQAQWSGTWGLSASIPIFDGFQRLNRLKQKEFATEQLELNRETLKQNIEKDFGDAKEQLILSNSQIESQESNMSLAQENYDGIKTSYNEGVANLTELLDSEYALRQAQSNYLNALLQSKVAEVSLLKSSGRLSQLISNPTINN